jgi:tetraacyldisaccharide 4'-kinase
MLVASGEKPAILSRGYGRRRVEDGVVIVSDGTRVLADLATSGDEPMQLAADVPGAVVLVCEQRAIAGALARRALGATVLILDDGFQHRQMRRDADIVLVTPADLSARRVPFGRLRESVRALGRADAVIIDDDQSDASRLADATSRVATLAPRARVFSLHRSLGQPSPLASVRPWPDRPAPVVAVAGIAGPERFFGALSAAGWTVARTLGFADHHDYRARDIARMAAALAESGAHAIVTTAKDAVRLRALGPLPFPAASVPLEVRVDPADDFRTWIFARLAEARA